jgi:ABC-2 type transport system ATP-binding protein
MASTAGRPEADGVLVLQDLVKRWPGTDDPVLDRVDMALTPGTVTLVRGRNGAGKTTLLRIAAGLIAADSGTVTVAGLDPRRERREAQRHIGFASAGNGALYPRLTVDDHLALWSRLALMSSADVATRRQLMLDSFELEELRGRRVDRLSTGQRQRLRLALAFVHAPALVLLDEPDVSLDEEARGLLDAEIARLRERGGAAIVCGPSGAAESLAFDQRFMISGGRLVAS